MGDALIDVREGARSLKAQDSRKEHLNLYGVVQGVQGTGHSFSCRNGMCFG